jgi:hypothetical protein
MTDKRQLLCTFSDVTNFKNVVNKICEFYEVYNNQLFIFSNVKNEKEIFVTYNIINNFFDLPKFPHTISIHRKKQTNTLYTLNAMNKIICDENAGVFDKTYKVNWELYKDSLIIINESFIKIISIKIFDIIN